MLQERNGKDGFGGRLVGAIAITRERVRERDRGRESAREGDREREGKSWRARERDGPLSKQMKVCWPVD